MPKLIYVADDEKNICFLIENFLEKEGYEVECFGDGESLLDAFQKKAPDLCILDIMMPGMDGFEVLRELREQEHGETHLPVMLLTARAEDADQVRGLEVVRTITLPSRFRRSCWRPACAHCSNEKAAPVHRSNSSASCRSMSCAVRSWWRTSRST